MNRAEPPSEPRCLSHLHFFTGSHDLRTERRRAVTLVECVVSMVRRCHRHVVRFEIASVFRFGIALNELGIEFVASRLVRGPQIKHERQDEQGEKERNEPFE